MAMQLDSLVSLPLAPAYFIGTQEGLPATATRAAIPSFDLYNLTAPLGKVHPVGSTVSAQTLIAHGFRLPSKLG